jgi:hypothetical protein
VPPNAPVKLTGQRPLTIATHALIRDVSRGSRSSRNAQKYVDASVDIYFGPQAPQGKESNWVPTKPGGQFEILFGFTVRRSHSSIRPGSCPISRR